MSGEANAYNIFGLLIDKEIVLLVLGAVIGFGASLLTNYINNRKQRKKEEKERSINIIVDAVKFVVKAYELANDLIIKMRHFNRRLFNAPSKDAVIAQKEKTEYLFKAGEKATIFFEELKINSVQLQRLGNQDILNKFETLTDIYNELFEALLIQEREIQLKFVNKLPKYKKYNKEFIDYCLEIIKIDAPVRTPAALTRKKDLAE